MMALPFFLEEAIANCLAVTITPCCSYSGEMHAVLNRTLALARFSEAQSLLQQTSFSGSRQLGIVFIYE
jgi:hypothetical protein